MQPTAYERAKAFQRVVESCDVFDEGFTLVRGVIAVDQYLASAEDELSEAGEVAKPAECECKGHGRMKVLQPTALGSSELCGSGLSLVRQLGDFGDSNGQ